MSSTMLIPATYGGTALIESIPATALVFIYLFSMEKHSLTTVSTYYFSLEKINKGSPDFSGLLHVLLSIVTCFCNTF